MTEIRNPKPLHHLKIGEFQTCFGHWILEFVIYLRFGAWSLGFLNPSIPKQVATFTGNPANGGTDMAQYSLALVS